MKGTRTDLLGIGNLYKIYGIDHKSVTVAIKLVYKTVIFKKIIGNREIYLVKKKNRLLKGIFHYIGVSDHFRNDRI